MQYFRAPTSGLGCSLFLVSALLLMSGCQYGAGEENKAAQVIDPSNADLDVLSNGNFRVVQGEYAVEEETRDDPKVLPGQVTDLRAAVYLPEGAGPFPLAILLHGNHGTCGKVPEGGGPREDSGTEFTTTGRCPAGWIEAPSYRGYAYLGTHLASHGFVVVSINANRGITAGEGPDGDGGLIQARGRLVLKHLAWLSAWNDGSRPSPAGLGLDLKGKLNFDQVGFMGHSRGGEGVRAAYQMYQEYQRTGSANNNYAEDIPQLSVKGIFELAPVDFAESQPLNALGTNWTVVIASCDGDVSNFQGAGVFRRRRQASESSPGVFSSVFVIPGANHNYFNTEWQESDSEGCGQGVTPLWDTASASTAGSERQQLLGKAVFSAFFRGFVSQIQGRENYQRVFDPQFEVPGQIRELGEPVRESLGSGSEVVPAVSVQGSSSVVVEEQGQGAGGDAFSGLSLPSTALGQRSLARIGWNSAAAANQVNVVLWSNGHDLSDDWILAFSLARFESCGRDTTCDMSDQPVDLGVQLLLADGSVSSSVALADYVTMRNNLNRFELCQEPTWPVEAPNGSGCCRQATFDECLGQPGAYPTDNGLCCLERTIKELLFHEVPIELRDFRAGAGLQQVRGVRFTLDRHPGTNLFLDKAFSVRPASDDE